MAGLAQPWLLGRALSSPQALDAAESCSEAATSCINQIKPIGRCHLRSVTHTGSWGRRRLPLLVHCQGGTGGPGENYVPGDGSPSSDVQDALAKIVKAQARQVRVTEYVADRSEALRGVADAAAEGLTDIANRTKREIEAAQDRAYQKFQADADELEKELAANRLEIEASQRELDEYEKRTAEKRNEGLFFKRLYAPTSEKDSKALKITNLSPEERELLETELQAIRDAANDDFGSMYRKVGYGFFLLIVGSFLWVDVARVFNEDKPDTAKLIGLTALFVAIATQLFLEAKRSGEERG